MEGIRCAVPEILNVVEVQLDDGPQVVSDPGRVAVFDQPVSVKNESGGTQCRPIPLGSTYINIPMINRFQEPKGSGIVPQPSVKAVSLMLNFGSPRPPVYKLPLRLGTCWMRFWERKNSSIFPRQEVSSPVTTFSTINLKVREASRIQV